MYTTPMNNLRAPPGAGDCDENIAGWQICCWDVACRQAAAAGAGECRKRTPSPERRQSATDYDAHVGQQKWLVISLLLSAKLQLLNFSWRSKELV
jgi:hypothetical protein